MILLGILACISYFPVDKSYQLIDVKYVGLLNDLGYHRWSWVCCRVDCVVLLPIIGLSLRDKVDYKVYDLLNIYQVA